MYPRLIEPSSVTANRGRFVGFNPPQQPVGCWRQIRSCYPCLMPSQEQARSPSLGHNHHFCRARAPRVPAAPCSALTGCPAAHGAQPILLPHVGHAAGCAGGSHRIWLPRICSEFHSAVQEEAGGLLTQEQGWFPRSGRRH